MELLFLGTGAALYDSAAAAAQNFNSNMLLTHQNQRLLIDCGIDIKFSLHHQQLDFSDIDAVYISHLHFDHAGGLEWLALSCKFFGKKHKPKLFIHNSLVDVLWKNCLSGGLSTLDDTKAELGDFFDVVIIDDKQQFHWQGITFNLVKTDHYCSNHNLMPSFGLQFDAGGKTLFITTDTRFTPHVLEPHYQQATLIFHDCDVSNSPSPVHAGYNQLTTLSKETKAKMWLYHYATDKLPDATKDGFLGFVHKGQLFNFNTDE